MTSAESKKLISILKHEVIFSCSFSCGTLKIANLLSIISHCVLKGPQTLKLPFNTHKSYLH